MIYQRCQHEMLLYISFGSRYPYNVMIFTGFYRIARWSKYCGYRIHQAFLCQHRPYSNFRLLSLPLITHPFILNLKEIEYISYLNNY
jgi:hypothetical protein